MVVAAARAPAGMVRETAPSVEVTVPPAGPMDWEAAAPFGVPTAVWVGSVSPPPPPPPGSLESPGQAASRRRRRWASDEFGNVAHGALGSGEWGEHRTPGQLVTMAGSFGGRASFRASRAGRAASGKGNARRSSVLRSVATVRSTIPRRAPHPSRPVRIRLFLSLAAGPVPPGPSPSDCPLGSRQAPHPSGPPPLASVP